jgi:aminoglycoside phosphotransferase (APT) family kinase protein
MSVRNQLGRQRIGERLVSWLASRLDGAAEVAVSELELVEGGYSNDTGTGTAFWRDAQGASRTQRFVLRMQPTAHSVFPNPDVLFQSRVMRAIGRRTAPPVPAVWLEESDPSVLGLPFYLMKFIEGRMPKLVPSYHQSGWVAELAPEQRAVLYNGALEAMARLHGLDWRDGFDFLERPGAGTALERHLAHVARWSEWAFADRDFGPISAAADYVQRERPQHDAASVLWGDAHPVNMLFAPDLSVAAMLDFEIAALGPPEIDLGWWLAVEELISSAQRIERLPGIPSLESTVEAYGRMLGRPARNMPYYRVLGALGFALSTVRVADRLVATGKLANAPDYGGVKLFKKILKGLLP